MKQNWNRFADAVDGLALHWRILVFALLAGSLLWAVMRFGISPQIEQQRQLTQQQEALTAQATAANAQDDGRKALLEEIGQLKRELAKRSPDAASRGTPAVNGQQMLRVLDRLLSQSPGLTLVKLERIAAPDAAPAAAPAPTAAAAPAAASAVAATTPPTAPREYLSITLRGSYFDLLDYLERAERLPYPLHWHTLDYSVEHYPVATLTLTIYTLGDGSWLAI
ncbi:hypothetical protein [Ferriphaselus sp. R-1]|uniref:hypothetical protein n=1 Tax=Ferriphaselus sp. R-1 TaxID=1485544 RepID=UPI00054DAAD3|nr:hypothetical protein [Ferriphaselus sp. R-1]